MLNTLPVWAQTVLTLLISAAGGLLADAVGLPAGWLMGGAVAVSLAAMLGLPVRFPDRVRDVAFVLIGMTMGASVASDSLSLIPQWPISIAGLALELVLIIGLTGWMLTRVFKLDRGTAYLSSFPGHLSFVMAIASAGAGDPRQIAIIQIIRILMLTVAVPIGALFLPIDAMFETAPSPPMDLVTLLALAAGCTLGGWIFVRLRVPAGFVLGAMAAATAAKLGGLFDASMLEPLVIVTFIMTGALLGSRFVGITRAEFQRAALGGLIATAMTMAITTIVTLGVAMLVDMPFGQIWVGLAPGALEGMGALGIALGYDTAFIAAHHVMRLLMLSFAIPAVVVLIQWLDRRSASSGPEA